MNRLWAEQYYQQHWPPLEFIRFPFGIIRCPHPNTIRPTKGFVISLQDHDPRLPIIRHTFHCADVAEVFVFTGPAPSTEKRQLEQVRNTLKRAGIDHIVVRSSDDGVWRSFIMDEQARMHFVEFRDDVDDFQRQTWNMRRMLNLYIRPLMRWIPDNATGLVVLDERGICFEHEEDAALFRLTYNIPYRPL
jgi:hypothetical protein